MNCSKFQNRIADYAVGLLSGRARTEVESHLAECSSCREEFEKQDQTMLLIENADAIEPPVGLWNGVYNRITATPVHPSIWNQLQEGRYRRRTGWSLGFVTVALTALILITTTRIPQPAAGIEAQEYVRGHVIYASQDVLADQTALYSATVMAERTHTLKDRTL